MAFNRFNHLQVPEYWEKYFTKYPQGMTILESLFQWVKQVDDMVDNQNKLIVNVDNFRDELAENKTLLDLNIQTIQAKIDSFIEQFDPKLATQVKEILTEWQVSGFLEVIISEALQTQMDTLASETSLKLTDFDNRINNLISELKESNYTIGDVATLIAALKRKVVNVTIWADSVGAGADSIDVTSTYAYVFIKKLQVMFPDVIFNATNLSIGGRTLQDAINENYVSPTNFNEWWSTTPNKSWRDYVKQTEPDFLILGFGMNPIGRQREYGYFLELTKYFINTFTKVPSVALITTYLPNKDWVGEVLRNERIHNMRVTKYWGENSNYSVIDVGSLFRTYVDGINESSYTSEKFEGTDRFTILDGKYTSDFKTRNFVLQFDTFISTSVPFVIRFGLLSELKITPNTISWYNNGYIVGSEILVNLVEKAYSFRIERENQTIRVFIDGVLIGTIFGFEDMNDGVLIFNTNNGATPISTLSGIIFLNTASAKLLTVEDALGKYIENDFGIKLPFGGNGVNHPTSKTIEYIYKPLIDLFTKELELKLITKSSRVYFDIPKTIPLDTFTNVGVDWGTNGGLNHSGLQIKFHTLTGSIDNPTLNRLYNSDGYKLTYRNLLQANIQELSEGEYTIINTANLNLLIIVNPTNNYTLHELKDI